MKICTKCGNEQKLSAFSKDAQKLSGFSSWCKACSSARGKSYYENNKLASHARTAKWREENSDKQRSINARSHHKNKEKRNAYDRQYRAENFEHMRALSRKWAKDNLDKMKLTNAARRAAKIEAKPIWAADEFESFAVEEMYDLASLRTEATGLEWHVDHIVPLRSERVCGLHCSANLQVIPAVDNYRKGNRVWPNM